jgi:hypothetical protein
MDKNNFIKEYRAIVNRALSLVKKAVNERFLSLEEMIDEEKFIQRDIFECGFIYRAPKPARVSRAIVGLIPCAWLRTIRH